ncbi:hypothetical protein [Prescottella agglutinans]|uniref:hypothetical protein n=1 Tax=Prescottella agglutinans TaxID=1644129 RepID=UPI000FDD0073|nr:hypothetical protein [Prescottella agglutinans]
MGVRSSASRDVEREGRRMYNWDVQNAIVAFVDSLRPMSQFYRDLYYGSLYSFADHQSELLTMLGYPPVP